MLFWSRTATSHYLPQLNPATMAIITLESLPAEIITDILSELDLASLVIISYLSRRLHSVASDACLNPWRAPIFRNLRAEVYEPCLKNLFVRHVVPRQNWVEIMSRARSDFLLWEATIPNLKEHEWEQCFRRRFLPGWRRWKKEGHTWKEAFLKYVLYSYPLRARAQLQHTGYCIVCGTVVAHRVLLMKRGQSQFHLSNIRRPRFIGMSGMSF